MWYTVCNWWLYGKFGMGLEKQAGPRKGLGITSLTQHKYLPDLGQGRRCCCVHASVWIRRSDPGSAWEWGSIRWNEKPPSSSSRWHTQSLSRGWVAQGRLMSSCGRSFIWMPWAGVAGHGFTPWWRQTAPTQALHKPFAQALPCTSRWLLGRDEPGISCAVNLL